MLNKQSHRFLNRTTVQVILVEKIITDLHITRLNRLFTNKTCKQLENMHTTIAKFVLYDLNNYEGRLRRLAGIPGTSRYTQLLRYGKSMFVKIYLDQSAKKVKHFQNMQSYWRNQGYTAEEASFAVSRVQRERNALSVEKTSGTSMYSCRSISYWLTKGFSEVVAKQKVKELQSRAWKNHTKEERDARISKWLYTMDNKSDSEKSLINLKRSPSIEGQISRGDSMIEATTGYLEFCKKMKSKPNQTWSKISQELFKRLDEKLNGTTFYQTKNYEYGIENYRVDFYHKESNTVVEFYGDFFHRNPLIFESTHTAFGYAAADKWLSDSVRIKEIADSELVRQVIIVWEFDFRSNPTAVVDSILFKIGE